MEDENSHSRISLAIHTIAGIAVGLLSPFLGRAMYAIAVAMVLAAVLRQVTGRMLGKKEISWWVGNGLFIFVFAWLDMWIFMANVF